MTTPTTERRQVSYRNLDEILADAERAVARKARVTGRWSIGQILEHQARVMDRSIDGFGFTAPFYFRWIGALFMKKRFLEKAMPPGFHLKGKVKDELAPAETSDEAGLDHLRKAIARQRNESKRVPSPFLGNLTREEWEKLLLRHGELHMSFISDDA